ncbi:alpha/beta-hydrolase, partial [Lophiostoma macrostomum CBS 122681]
GHAVESGAKPLTEDLVLHESVPMQVRDGTTLYSDIFLPPRFQDLNSEASEPVPAIVAWSPYGKQKGTTILDDFPFRAGVSKTAVSGLQKFEGPDPDFWCQHGYGVVNVDSRGAYTSEGNLVMFGHQEAEDGSDFITWVYQQPWCNGRVALASNSWLALIQWRIGALRPEGLAALAPWEGFSDYFRHHLFPGGIFFFRVSTKTFSVRTLATQGKLEDVCEYAKDHQLYNAYWEDKIAHPEWINVPVYAVASWTGPVHTTGMFEAFNSVPNTVPRWLRVHNTQEWPDFYEDSNQQDLLRFFDRYLKDIQNDWEATPKVRLSVLQYTLDGKADTVNRPESAFPLAGTQYRKLFIMQDETLSSHPAPEEFLISYDSKFGNATFYHHFDQASETTGYFLAHLVMSCPEHTDMDVFVQVEKLSSKKQRQSTLVIRPPSTIAQWLLKLMHSWNVMPGSSGLAFHHGPEGCLRASHALGKSAERSTRWKPHYTFTERIPMKKGEVRSLDISLRPVGMYWEKGDYLKFTVQGTMVMPFPLQDLEMHHTDNKGLHVLHCGGRGEDSSYLLSPFV